MKRAQILNQLPKGGVVAEIGVYKGQLSAKILEITKPKKLVLIDPWAEQKEIVYDKSKNYSADGQYENRFKGVVKQFKKHDHVQIMREYSLDAVTIFPQEYFDWVFIDADHRYQAVVKDLAAWYPKIKRGGYLAGHDYMIKNHDNFGVKQAVDEFVDKHNLQIDILMPHRFACWAIKRP